MAQPWRRKRHKRCRFCHALFRPHPRLGPRQYACGAPACQRERHAQNCRAWRRRHPEVTQAHYRDYVQPARERARPPTAAPRLSRADVEIFLSGLRPELRDAIIALGQGPPGVRAP